MDVADVVSALVAIGTLVLAGATYWLANSTAAMADSAGGQAEAASAQARAMREQVQRAHRPVLVPVAYSDEADYRPDGTIAQEAGPAARFPPDATAFVAAENIGMGPALNVRGSYTAPRGSAVVRAPTVGIAAGERGIVTFKGQDGADDLSYSWQAAERIDAVLEYDDVAGATYRTRLSYDARSTDYRSTVEPPVEGTGAGTGEPQAP